MVLEMWYNILIIFDLAKIGRTFYILEIFTQVDGITFKLFVHYSNYSNSWVRIALFGIRIRSFFRNRIYSVFSIRCIFKNRIYSVFDIRSNFTIRSNTVLNWHCNNDAWGCSAATFKCKWCVLIPSPVSDVRIEEVCVWDSSGSSAI